MAVLNGAHGAGNVASADTLDGLVSAEVGPEAAAVGDGEGATSDDQPLFGGRGISGVSRRLARTGAWVHPATLLQRVASSFVPIVL